MLSGAWPEWIAEHPWLLDLLQASEAWCSTATKLTHLHLLAAYQADDQACGWLVACGAPGEWREECLWMLDHLGQQPASDSNIPVVTEARDMLELAATEARATSIPLDARAFLPAAIDWTPRKSRPTLRGMRALCAGRVRTPRLNLDWRTWRRALAADHGKPADAYGPKLRYSYRSEGPGPLRGLRTAHGG